MKKLLSYILAKKHHAFRRELDWDLASEYAARELSPRARMTDRFQRLCAAETPVLLPDESICFVRTVKNIPEVFTEEEWRQLRTKHHIHERGYLSNLSPDYASVIREGLWGKRESVDTYSRQSIDALLELTERYRQLAVKEGKQELAAVLERVPKFGARNFREALQSFRILHFGLWLEGNYHNTVGRFDQYMYPYLAADLAAGIHTRESALALLEDFFLSFNKDSDLYVGVQQGDNGQSMVLGGLTQEGKDGFNLLSELCLEASDALRLIDPKINLRVSKNTPIEVYELGSRLTKAGLGFPQYSNDDVVIPGLERLGYRHEDAVEYVTAACWEFIVPKVGADVANIGALSFPKVVDIAFHRELPGCESFEEFLQRVRGVLHAQVDEICASLGDLWFVPSPYMDVFFGRDISLGGDYNNYGIHGTGIATGADSLAAIRKHVFEEKTVTAEEYIQAVDSDFTVHSELLPLLRYETPKMGQNNDAADSLGVWLLDCFADALEGKKNSRGGVFRAGTGSAMYYLWHAAELGASPDGRRKGEAFGTNFSPSLFARIGGPLSVIASFGKCHFEQAINGGPLTLEFSNSMFSSDDSIGKVARLVKTYMDRGGHQLQLNAVDLERLRDAQRNPERHPQLVVRIWGWSAYFVELDKEFQDHVMARQEYTL